MASHGTCEVEHPVEPVADARPSCLNTPHVAHILTMICCVVTGSGLAERDSTVHWNNGLKRTEHPLEDQAWSCRMSLGQASWAPWGAAATLQGGLRTGACALISPPPTFQAWASVTGQHRLRFQRARIINARLLYFRN